MAGEALGVFLRVMLASLLTRFVGGWLRQGGQQLKCWEKPDSNPDKDALQQVMAKKVSCAIRNVLCFAQ